MKTMMVPYLTHLNKWNVELTEAELNQISGSK